MRERRLMARLPVAGPWITEKEIAYVTDAVTNAWFAQHAMYHQRFESALAAYLGVRHAVTLPSCTSAIHLSLAALGIGPGDEVVVPETTWIATAAPITYVGASPVFADIEPDTWCLSAKSLERCISSRTRAVIPVDLYGGMADMDAIRDVAAGAGLAVIEDAAEAMGAAYHGRKAGSFGATGVFSFHGSKVLTTGEGGALVTDDQALYERVLVLRDHGRLPGDVSFFNEEIGFKYKMSAMQAALGLAQLERIDELVARKREIFGWYAERLSRVEGLSLNVEPAGTENVYWMVTMVLEPQLSIDKQQLMCELGARGIDSRPFFHPLSSIPAYRDTPAAAAAQARNDVSYRISPYGLNLPSGFNLAESDVDRVCAAVHEIVKR